MLGSEQGKVLHLSSSSWPTAKPEVLYPGDPCTGSSNFLSLHLWSEV